MSIIRKEQLTNPLSASYALTASYAENASVTIDTSSLVTTSSFNAFTSSINNFTSSYNTGSFTGSFTGNFNGTASWAEYVVNESTTNTGSLLTTASIVSNTITFTKGDGSTFPITVDTGSGGTGDTSGLVTTSSFNAFTSSINNFTSSYNTGSFSGSFSGSFYGTASWAEYVVNAGNVDTSGLVTTSSFNAFTSSINTFTSSYNTGSFTGSFKGNFTGSLNGTATQANTVYTQAQNANIAYSIPYLSANGTTYAALYNDTTQLTYNPFLGKLTISGSGIELTGSIIATQGFTGSLFGTASWATNALTALNGFPYFGSAAITGSLVVTNGTNNILIADTINGNYQLNDGSGILSVDWNNRTLNDGNRTPVDWFNRYLQSSNADELSIDWENRVLYASDGTTAHLDWSNPSYMQLGSINESPIVSVLGIDSNGNIYSTASSAIGGGGAGGDFVPSSWTGSAASQFAGTASRATTASLALTASSLTTGTYQITSSWATNALTASLVSTASRLNADNTSIFGDNNRMTITASNGIIINAGNPGVDLQSKITVTGDVLPGGTITNNTSSWSLGSPTQAWKDLYVSNGSVYFISGSNTASISFTNGNIDFGGTNITIPTGSIVTSASYAATASITTTATSASYAATASLLLGSVTSASYAETASYISNGVSFIGSGSIITGSTAISSSYGLYIPANTFGVGDLVEIHGVYTKPNGATSTGFNVYINTSDQLSGATQLGQYSTTTFRWIPFTRLLAIESTTSTALFPTNVSHYNDIIPIATATARASLNIDWTVDQYILFAASNASLADRTDTFRFYAKKI